MKIITNKVNKTNDCMVSFTINFTNNGKIAMSVRCYYSRANTNCNWYFHTNEDTYIHPDIQYVVFSRLQEGRYV